MGVSADQLNRAITAATRREAQGYFVKAKAGDQTAASLFVRLVAYDLNPIRDTTDYGWLSKQPGETNVDGWAEDAIVLGINPADFENVVDLVNGAGAPGASIGGAVKPRRPGNQWVAPQPLTAEEMAYLTVGGVVTPPVPPSPPQQPYPSEVEWWGPVYEARVAQCYAEAGKTFPDNPAAFRWFSRCAYDIGAGMPKEASMAKHISELRAALGLP